MPLTPLRHTAAPGAPSPHHREPRDEHPRLADAGAAHSTHPAPSRGARAGLSLPPAAPRQVWGAPGSPKELAQPLCTPRPQPHSAGPTLAFGTSILPGVFRWPSSTGACPARAEERSCPELCTLQRGFIGAAPPGPQPPAQWRCQKYQREQRGWCLGDAHPLWPVARRRARPFPSFVALHYEGAVRGWGARC